MTNEPLVEQATEEAHEWGIADVFGPAPDEPELCTCRWCDDDKDTLNNSADFQARHILKTHFDRLTQDERIEIMHLVLLPLCLDLGETI